MSKGPQTLDPAKLTFLHDETFVSAGHLVLVATYPSWSKKGARHRVTIRDDGSPVGCTCTGQALVGKCYHLDQGEEIAREYRRRDLRALASQDVWRDDSWLAHQPAGSLDRAQQLLWDAVGDVVAERYAAKHGRVPEARQEAS